MMKSSFMTMRGMAPQKVTHDIWIDASDYAVGAIANGATITNKGGSGFNFTVSGTGLSVQVNSRGKKEFVFNGATFINAPSVNKSYFTKYHNGVNSYSIMFLGSIGTSSNPDAFIGMFGNNAGSSLNTGLYLAVENRVAQPATKGLQYSVSKSSSNNWPWRMIKSQSTLVFNQILSLHIAYDGALLKDHIRAWIDGNLYHVQDQSRTTNNTTSGIGAPIAAATGDPTYDFQIGAMGNNAGPFTGTMEQFIIFNNSTVKFSTTTVRGMDHYFEFIGQINKTANKFIPQNFSISDEYVLGGWYHKNADKSKTLWLTSRGADHFTPGTDRTGVQSLSVHNGKYFPAYSSWFTDASTSPHNGISGGLLPSGKGIICYAKYTSATGAYLGIFSRLTTDFETWGSENTITLPSTSPALTGYTFHDIGVLADNGDMMVPWYAASGTSLYKVYVTRISSDGTVFAHKEIYSSVSTYKNEVSIANLGSGNWIAAVRVEAAANTATTYVHEYFESNDDCETWVSVGTTSYGGRMYVYPHPPMIRTFLLNGTLVVAAYMFDRGDRRWWVQYVTAADLLANGAAALNNEMYLLDVRAYGNSQGWESGYPLVIHPYNTIEAEGVIFAENSASVCVSVFFKIDREHEARVKTELGI